MRAALEDKEPTESEFVQFVSSQVAWWDAAIDEWRDALKLRDTKMVEAHARRSDLAEDPREGMTPGCRVIVRQRNPAKRSARWEGPWMVLRSVGPHATGVEVLDHKSNVRVVAASNCRLYRGSPVPEHNPYIRAPKLRRIQQG